MALHVSATQDTITVDLNAGRTISVPAAWYPRLLPSTVAKRKEWRDEP